MTASACAASSITSKPATPSVVAADDDRVTRRRRPACIRRAARCRRRRRLQTPATIDRRARTVEADLRARGGDVLDLHVFAEDELVEVVADALATQRGTSSRIASPSSSTRMSVDHPALRGQHRGVAAGPGRQRRDIVGEQALKIGRAIGAGQQDRPTATDRRVPRRRAAPRIRCCYPVSMRFHCTALAGGRCWPRRAAPRLSSRQPTPAHRRRHLRIFFRGTQVGREQVTLSRGSSGWIITSTGRSAPPIDLNITPLRDEVHAPTGSRSSSSSKRALQQRACSWPRPRSRMTTAINEITQNGATDSKEDQISARDGRPPEQLLRAYEALAVRLAASRPAPRSRSTSRHRRDQGHGRARSPTQTLQGPRHARDTPLRSRRSATPARRSTLRDRSTTSYRFVRLEMPSAGAHGRPRRRLERRACARRRRATRPTPTSASRPTASTSPAR